MHPLARSALQEVVELHAFFEAWLGGAAPRSDATFARIEDALAQRFTMVEPDGRRLGRGEVLAWLRQAHGSRAGVGFRIAVRDQEALFLAPPVVTVGYLEEQEANGQVTRRRSTAVLAAPAGGGRPLWHALHETWIASDPSLAATRPSLP